MRLPILTGGLGSPFDPTKISGIELWLRADLGVTYHFNAAQTMFNPSGSNIIDGWVDQSGKGHIVSWDLEVGTTPIYYPTGSEAVWDRHNASHVQPDPNSNWSLHPVIFLWEQTFLAAAGFTLDDPFTCIMVAQVWEGDLSQSARFFADDGLNMNMDYHDDGDLYFNPDIPGEFENARPRMVGGTPVTGYASTTPYIQDGEFGIYEGSWNGAAGIFRRNNTIIFSPTLVGASHISGNLGIGCTPSFTQAPIEGFISEVIVYSKVLSAPERTLLYSNYLLKRYTPHNWDVS